jgi:hypothetical protein
MIITKGLGHNLRSREVIGYLQKFLESTGEKHLERLELLEKSIK